MTMILGKKIGMTKVYDAQGAMVPVTVIQAGPCKVLQVKTADNDGYDALQLGFDPVKPSRQKKPMLGHCKQAGCQPQRFVREMRLTDAAENAVGDEVNVAQFQEQEIKYVDIIGTTKGKGFAGAVKRHGFKGQLASHGVERKHRSPGGIGMVSGSKGRGIKKGKKMSGHLGCVRCTSKNHQIVEIDSENNLIIVKGSIPGPNNGYVMVSKAKTKS